MGVFRAETESSAHFFLITNLRSSAWAAVWLVDPSGQRTVILAGTAEAGAVKERRGGDCDK